MITRIIDWSLKNRFLILVGAFFLIVTGIYTLKNTAVDAIPDLSDVQVIIKPLTQVKHRKWWKIKSRIP